MRATIEDCSPINYESKMLQTLNVHINERLSSPATDDQDTVERNALLEAHLIHARNLIEFFIPGATRDDDILLIDFVDKQWSPTGPETERLGVLKVEIDKRLAHLTRLRHFDFGGWPSLLITGDLMILVHQFVSKFRQENAGLEEWFQEASAAQMYFEEGTAAV
jgi:hypothetical protein